jgi:hypothetical protein
MILVPMMFAVEVVVVTMILCVLAADGVDRFAVRGGTSLNLQ